MSKSLKSVAQPNASTLIYLCGSSTVKECGSTPLRTLGHWHLLESHSLQRSALDREYVELEFDLPELEWPIHVRGEVVGQRRVNGFAHGLAVAFIDLSQEAHDAIATYVERQLEDGESEGLLQEAAPTVDI